MQMPSHWRIRGMGPPTRDLVWTDFLAGETGVSWLWKIVAFPPFFAKANWKDLWLKAKDGFWWFWRCKKWSTNWIQDQWGAEMHVFKPFGWCWTKVWEWFYLQHFFAVRTLNIIFRRWQRLVETIFEMPGTHGEIWKENEPILPA